MEDLKEKWEKVKEVLKKEIPSNSYDTFVAPLVPSSFDANKLILLSPHGFTNQTLHMSYGELITTTLTEVFGEVATFEVLQDSNIEEIYKKEQKKLKKTEQKHDFTALNESKYDALTQMYSDCNLNTKYKFDNFVVGAYNKLAFGAAYAVAQGKKKFNPLFIYGGSGLGKTHLMQAIGNYILNKGKGKVKYVTSEEFSNDLITNLFKGVEKDSFTKGSETNKRMTKFRQKYRDVDVLLIDDIQFVAGKERTEEELFNTFNSLHNSGKQIVLTCDRLPSEIKGISERLKTRFEWGLMADIGAPDFETRMAILKQMTEQDGNIHFSLEVLEFLATIYKNNIRELEGAYNKVCAFCSVYEKEPTLEVVKKAINYKAEVKKVTGMGIVEKVADYYDLKKEDICGPSRVANISHARKSAVYVMKELTNDSWQSIGRILGGRKHSTIINAYDEAEKEIKLDDKFAEEINTIFNIINQI